MKTYQNPQPQAVERINKLKEKPQEHPPKMQHYKTKKSNKEIFKTESEEQAWRDVLEKGKPS